MKYLLLVLSLSSFTSIAIAKSAQQKSCVPYSGDLSVTIKGIPLLSTSSENLSSIFPNKSNSNTVQYCTNTRNYGDFTQMNSIHYFFENNNIKGVFISQISSN
jgi:hypothetical protein